MKKAQEYKDESWDISRCAALWCSVLLACTSGASMGPSATEENTADSSIAYPPYAVTQADTGLCLQDKQRYNQRITQAEDAKQQHQLILGAYPGDAFLCVPTTAQNRRVARLFRYRAEDILRAEPDYSDPVETVSFEPFFQKSCRELIEDTFGRSRFGSHKCEPARGYAHAQAAYVCVAPVPPEESREQKRLFEQVKVLKERIDRDC